MYALPDVDTSELISFVRVRRTAIHLEGRRQERDVRYPRLMYTRPALEQQDSRFAGEEREPRGEHAAGRPSADLTIQWRGGAEASSTWDLDGAIAGANRSWRDARELSG